MTTRHKKRYTPVQVYVGEDTAGLWERVGEEVVRVRETDSRYSLSQYVTEAVREKLKGGASETYSDAHIEDASR